MHELLGIIFMHKVLRGPASQSYGLQVAKLAGVPDVVVNQAKSKLQILEAEDQPTPSIATHPTGVAVVEGRVASNTKLSTAPVSPAQADMFAAISHPVENLLQAKSADDMTPRQALELVYKLQGMVRDS